MVATPPSVGGHRLAAQQQSVGPAVRAVIVGGQHLVARQRRRGWPDCRSRRWSGRCWSRCAARCRRPAPGRNRCRRSRSRPGAGYSCAGSAGCTPFTAGPVSGQHAAMFGGVSVGGGVAVASVIDSGLVCDRGLEDVVDRRGDDVRRQRRAGPRVPGHPVDIAAPVISKLGDARLPDR